MPRPFSQCSHSRSVHPSELGWPKKPFREPEEAKQSQPSLLERSDTSMLSMSIKDIIETFRNELKGRDKLIEELRGKLAM
mmetsp:Transcript_52096/g.112902  ORF Transcript_52096/g.112902 Transcript_52096/m.112902 type:complete len:80 (-) Transcript_52096:110-349(-)